MEITSELFFTYVPNAPPAVPILPPVAASAGIGVQLPCVEAGFPTTLLF